MRNTSRDQISANEPRNGAHMNANEAYPADPRDVNSDDSDEEQKTSGVNKGAPGKHGKKKWKISSCFRVRPQSWWYVFSLSLSFPNKNTFACK